MPQNVQTADAVLSTLAYVLNLAKEELAARENGDAERAAELAALKSSEMLDTLARLHQLLMRCRLVEMSLPEFTQQDLAAKDAGLTWEQWATRALEAAALRGSR